ncbi:MAG: hypothetical protein J2P37_32825, partial [Ktedonobacteraceae bacterium]|nr:hypothetical protein [Ktedonobacteraceae bacterium]
MDKVTPKQLEIKMAGQALECGTLAVLLSLLQPHTLVFLSPLTLASSYDGQYKQDYLIHVTARPSHTGPILYASFQA